MMHVESLERRKLRSNISRQASGLLLESIAQAHSLRLLALSDRRGLTLVAWGDAAEAEVLAAYAPLLSRTLDPISRDQIFDSLSEQVAEIRYEQVSVRRFEVSEEELFLVAVGESGAAKDVALYRAMMGVRRILGT